MNTDKPHYIYLISRNSDIMYDFCSLTPNTTMILNIGNKINITIPSDMTDGHSIASYQKLDIQSQFTFVPLCAAYTQVCLIFIFDDCSSSMENRTHIPDNITFTNKCEMLDTKMRRELCKNMNDGGVVVDNYIYSYGEIIDNSSELSNTPIPYVVKNNSGTWEILPLVIMVGTLFCMIPFFCNPNYQNRTYDIRMYGIWKL